ncbi:OLC1v1032229C1 [Oldenlandia corymbosa var. corymbosa]|uniref:non-specific serine/threonine protein kinase n=1 Tax=Oldenlandia corymbosa var. corymbosa TaxID=529605 RepID=A0AAV1CKK4_OLDCO|nr:OLC1v1032229C1 [Oldenlandia corymbosa var. corymbosa]
MNPLLEIAKFWFLLIILEKSSVAVFAVDQNYVACVPRMCGKLNVSYPFFIQGQQESDCGFPEFGINCSNPASPMIHVPGNDYVIDDIFYPNQTIRVRSAAVSSAINCTLPQIGNLTEQTPLFVTEGSSFLRLLSNCTGEIPQVLQKYNKYYCNSSDSKSWGVAIYEDDQHLNVTLEICATNVLVPVEKGDESVEDNGVKDNEGLLRRGFLFNFNWSAIDCEVCLDSGGKCGFSMATIPYQFRCYCPDRPHRESCKPNRKTKLGLILGLVGAACVLLIFAILLLLWRRKKWVNGLSYILSRNSSKLELEDDSVYLGLSVFSYSELEEATKNFDSSKELGDGGFGTVYHGKLRDGREVAVKRLYEHNYKRMEQFMNEVEILTRLRHPNLVTLYGCTSRRSRELLLVYEYVPNGTVADHLNGHRANDKHLTWALRMNIAIETAEALAYLHASDIIHRDVKTNNILLDHNFSVKVADFGLSRLFPNDVTHVSTAPQGTPGYVDPEYHQCYQLTDKSDVYSFGVVLIELISSMPAVDISRHRHEINLANFAINRIQRCAFDDLIDPSLGYKTDAEILRMTTSVAELAFRCLQGEKEMRPAMEEVLESLKEIQNFKETLPENANGTLEEFNKTRNNPSGVAAFSPDSDDRVLLKNVKFPTSPVSVTGLWVSSSSTTTANSSS